MPGLERIIRGILKYQATMKNDMLKQFKMVKDNPQVSLQARSFKCDEVRTLMSRSFVCILLWKSLISNHVMLMCLYMVYMSVHALAFCS